MNSTMRWGCFPCLFAVLICLFGCGGPSERAGIIVIGLDGATWDLLQPWIDAGDLPTLAELQKTSAWGELQSVVPNLSPPAWTSAVTGVNPGKHSIFDFQRRIPGPKTGRLAGIPRIVNETAVSRRAKPIWAMIGDSGKRVLLLNIPMTDPPEPVNGYFVAGFPHHDQTAFTYPPELESRLGDYQLDELAIYLDEGKEEQLLRRYHRDLRNRTRVALEWIRTEPFDLCWLVLTATDRIQHTFWGFSDPENPNYDPERAARYGHAIHDLWVDVDHSLGEMFAAAGPDAITLLLSDHGFGPVRYDLKLQNYLHRAGTSLTGNEATGVGVLSVTDASRIYVLRQGRDPGANWPPAVANRVRDKLVAELRRATDPRTGERICDAVLLKEDIFEGPYSEKGPDIVVLPRQGYFITYGDPKSEVLNASYVEPHKPGISGWHRMNGIFALRGPQVRAGRWRGNAGETYSLLDVVPTLLYLMDEPVPEGLDGALMRGVFEETYLDAHPLRSRAPLEEEYRELSPVEMENLRNLPYIGG